MLYVLAWLLGVPLTLIVLLFLLGFGWNLGFVAGSAMLSGGVSGGERTRRPVASAS